MMGLSGDEKCLLFFQTLYGRAAEWFHNLLAGEIDSLDELPEMFQEKFKENCTKKKKFTYLSTAGQREHEDLTKFLTRWKDEVDKVEEMDNKTAMSLLVSGLRSGELYKEFYRRPPQCYQEAYNTAWDYADAEAHVSSKREAEQGHPKARISLKNEIKLPGRVKAEVMEGVIKQMIEAGELDQEYLAQAKQKKNQRIRPEGQPAEQNKKKKAPGKEHLHVIYGGSEGGDSASQRKKWGRELYVGIVALGPRPKQTRREPITFTDRDLPATGEDHNDPLVITMNMGGVDVSRVLVDTGSSVNVLYLETFEKLKLCRTRFIAYLASFGIKHNKASVTYPQGNGQVENANRTIVDELKKRLGEEGRKWLETLPHTIWAHRVTSRRATGETPFMLTYGCEARLPIEAEFPTFRETVYQPGQNEADHLAELNLVEEWRTMVAVRMAGYQQSVKRYHDNRVGPRYFQVHDEVLRRRDASKPNERGKLVRN
ncbi:unnamed protein product [Cuscuta campestris]|uniref:Integrase catalytic domain-containing protein n=1 Tax=Cuscuta campestris TaxID=132261 RepID=A0A484NHU3_9ASTE|nr:unnamed protein product [Cuscuta campestris]